MYNNNVSFPLKIAIGAKQTGQMTWGDTGPHLMEALHLNTYDLVNATSNITCILPIVQDYCFLHYQMCD